MKRSLKRGTMSPCDSVRYFAWQSCGERRKQSRYHHHRVELLQARHRLEQNGDDPAALHRFDRSAQQIRRERFEVLQNQHSVGLAQDVLRLLVVAPADLGARHEQVERVFAVLVVHAATDQLLDFSHALLLVSAHNTGPASQTC